MRRSDPRHVPREPQRLSLVEGPRDLFRDLKMPIQDLNVRHSSRSPLVRPPALIENSGRKARDRIEHFLRAAIDNDNTRRAYGRALGSFFAFLEDGGRARIQDIGPLDVRDYLEAAKANGLSTATLKQHMAAIRM